MIKVVEFGLAFGAGVILSGLYWMSQFNDLLTKFERVGQIHKALQLKYLEATAEMDAQRLERLESIK